MWYRIGLPSTVIITTVGVPGVCDNGSPVLWLVATRGLSWDCNHQKLANPNVAVMAILENQMCVYFDRH